MMKKIMGIMLTMIILIMCYAVNAEEIAYLTPENCEDLATMLDAGSPYDELMEQFADEYSGKIVAINGYIYRCTPIEILIRPGSHEDSAGSGPIFAFKHLRPNDFGFNGRDFPKFIQSDNNVHIVGKIKKYDDWDDCIVLEPISIEMWNPLLDGLDTSMYTVLKNGSEGEKVKALQQRLTDLFYLNSKVDGSYGNKTKTAVEKFQRAIKVEVTGIADPATQAVLFSEKAPEAKLSISSSCLKIGSNATTAWYVDGQEFTLKNKQTKTVKTIWGTYKFDAYGNYEKIED